VEKTTSIDAVRGKMNVYDIDASVAIGASDTISFRAFHEKGGTAVISKARIDMNITDAANGKFQVSLDPVDTEGLTVATIFGEQRNTRALYYEATLDQGGGPQIVTSGVMYLVD